jgi:hypothetical protein
MSSETPAAHLARLKIMFPAWSIWHGTATNEYHAAPPAGSGHRELVTAKSVPELETMISDAEKGPGYER